MSWIAYAISLFSYSYIFMSLCDWKPLQNPSNNHSKYFKCWSKMHQHLSKMHQHLSVKLDPMFTFIGPPIGVVVFPSSLCVVWFSTWALVCVAPRVCLTMWGARRRPGSAPAKPAAKSCLASRGIRLTRVGYAKTCRQKVPSRKKTCFVSFLIFVLSF